MEQTISLHHEVTIMMIKKIKYSGTEVTRKGKILKGILSKYTINAIIQNNKMSY